MKFKSYRKISDLFLKETTWRITLIGLKSNITEEEFIREMGLRYSYSNEIYSRSIYLYYKKTVGASQSYTVTRKEKNRLLPIYLKLHDRVEVKRIEK